MRKKFKILLITLLILITPSFISTSSGQERQITDQEIKEANLIFLEHKKLLVENELLKEQIQNYKYNDSILTRLDSLRVEQLNATNNALKNTVSKKDSTILLWKIGGISVSSLLLLLLIFK